MDPNLEIEIFTLIENPSLTETKQIELIQLIDQANKDILVKLIIHKKYIDLDEILYYPKNNNDDLDYPKNNKLIKCRQFCTKYCPRKIAACARSASLYGGDPDTILERLKTFVKKRIIITNKIKPTITKPLIPLTKDINQSIKREDLETSNVMYLTINTSYESFINIKYDENIDTSDIDNTSNIDTLIDTIFECYSIDKKYYYNIFISINNIRTNLIPSSLKDKNIISIFIKKLILFAPNLLNDYNYNIFCLYGFSSILDNLISTYIRPELDIIKYVRFNQGGRSTCWICSILNTIWLYETLQTLQNPKTEITQEISIVKKEYWDIWEKCRKTYDVNLFITELYKKDGIKNILKIINKGGTDSMQLELMKLLINDKIYITETETETNKIIRNYKSLDNNFFSKLENGIYNIGVCRKDGCNKFTDFHVICVYKNNDVYHIYDSICFIAYDSFEEYICNSYHKFTHSHATYFSINF